MKCRNALGDIESGREGLVRDESGGYLFTAQAVSGTEVARVRLGLWHGTWEPATRYRRPFIGPVVPRSRERDPQAAESARGRVAMRVAGADRPVVAVMPGNSGGAKGAGHPGLFSGQLRLCGMSW
jgi:hypothetical protein